MSANMRQHTRLLSLRVQRRLPHAHRWPDLYWYVLNKSTCYGPVNTDSTSSHCILHVSVLMGICTLFLGDNAVIMQVSDAIQYNPLWEV